MTETGAQRRLAAILVADVVGYSRLMGEDEHGTLSAVKALSSDLISPKITAHSGRLVKTTGDGILVEFASVVSAVKCAVEVQEALGTPTWATQPKKIQLRIGVNLGDVIAEESDVFGDGVNIAARLESLCDPASVLVSASAYDQVKGKLPFSFEDIGPQNLKNIAEPIRAYKVEANFADRVAPQPTDRPSIAVLPFRI